MKKVKLGVLVSGNGSNLQAIIDQIEKGNLLAEIRIVISNTEEAYALTRAVNHGIPSRIIQHGGYNQREDFEKRMVEELESHDVELVVLAGFMRVLGKLFLQHYPCRIMNIHPSLLPAFPGLSVQQRALEYGVKFSGCTVHFVEDALDAGPIIIQAAVPVLDDDTAETLAARILREEHRIYPEAIQLYASGKLEVRGRRVHVTGSHPAGMPVLHNPPVTLLDNALIPD